MKAKNLEIYVDSFLKLFYQNEDRLKRTLWFSFSGTCQEEFSPEQILEILKKFDREYTGLYSMPVRYKNGKKVGLKKKAKSNQYMFVEFDSEDGLQNVLKLVSQKKVSPFIQKAYIAGTYTFIHMHRSTRPDKSGLTPTHPRQSKPRPAQARADEANGRKNASEDSVVGSLDGLDMGGLFGDGDDY